LYLSVTAEKTRATPQLTTARRRSRGNHNHHANCRSFSALSQANWILASNLTNNMNPARNNAGPTIAANVSPVTRGNGTASNASATQSPASINTLQLPLSASTNNVPDHALTAWTGTPTVSAAAWSGCPLWFMRR